MKLFKLESLTNHLLDHTQIFNLTLDNWTIFNKYLKWRQDFLEDDLKILKVEDVSHPLLNHIQMLNLRLDDHITMTIFYKSLE